MSGGSLLVVSTPIGNMADLSPRAASTLADAALIACEDTRRAGRLLQLAGLEKRPLLRVDEHTQSRQLPRILEVLASGESVALISDAGTPLVSDPGAVVVAAVADAGFSVIAVPGPSAALAALVVSGMAADRFCFEGFLPRKGRERVARLGALQGEARPTVLYESPKRLAATLAELCELLGGERRVSVSRELTKLHEATWRGSLADAVADPARFPERGELVVVVDGAVARGEVTDDDIAAALRASDEPPGRRRADAVAAALGVSRRRVYELEHRD